MSTKVRIKETNQVGHRVDSDEYDVVLTDDNEFHLLKPYEYEVIDE